MQQLTPHSYTQKKIISIVLVPYCFMCTNVHHLFGEADKDPHLDPDSVPRRKRSKLRQRILSPAQRLQRTLDNNLQAPDFEIISDGDEPVTLIYARNKYIPPNEIGLGAMLLVSPTTTTELLTPQSVVAEDTVSCSMDISKKNSSTSEFLDACITFKLVCEARSYCLASATWAKNNWAVPTLQISPTV